MSYGQSQALQTAVYSALTADPGLTGMVGADIYDALPSGPLPGLYVSLGPEQVMDASDGSSAGAWHDIVISVVTEASGFHGAKQVAGAISDLLHDAVFPLTRGRMVGMNFLRAKATREPGGRRRIDLTFRARLEDS